MRPDAPLSCYRNPIVPLFCVDSKGWTSCLSLTKHMDPYQWIFSLTFQPSRASLSLSGVLLPEYDLSTPLPPVQSLQYFNFTNNAIQWMAGQEFCILQECFH